VPLPGDSVISPDAVLRDAVETIDRGAAKIAVVVDARRRLVGTVTDGDVRRALLGGASFATPVREVMNRHPRHAVVGEEPAELLARMTRERVRHLPIVDPAGVLVGLETLDRLRSEAPRDNPVILMAGGEGRRLRPLTEDVPKPMLTVGTKPILETILDGFAEAGFRSFFISVNYRAERIERHFGDGSARGLSIRYLREDRPLGTAGSLSLLPERPAVPMIVMNGDILTKVDYAKLLDFHRDQGGVATMCVRSYDLHIPYGVVEIDAHRLAGIVEKPTIRRFVNAGIYVLEPEALDSLSGDDILSMPALFEQLMTAGRKCTVFPIREYWLDIGQMADFERANADFESTFHKSGSGEP